MRKFFKMVKELQPQICFPPVADENLAAKPKGSSTNGETPNSLFGLIGAENGMICLVTTMHKIIKEDPTQLTLLNKMIEELQDGFETRYGMFLCSIIEPKYQWHY